MRSSNVDDEPPTPRSRRRARRPRQRRFSRSCCAWPRSGAIVQQQRRRPRSRRRLIAYVQRSDRPDGRAPGPRGLHARSSARSPRRRCVMFTERQRRHGGAAAAARDQPAGDAREAGAVTGAKRRALRRNGRQPGDAEGRRGDRRQLRLHAERTVVSREISAMFDDAVLAEAGSRLVPRARGVRGGRRRAGGRRDPLPRPHAST